MVFPGRYSTGCLRCRQRKVKCDEAKPSCRRCYIYGKECPGYTDQFHFRYGLTVSSFSPEKHTTRHVAPSNRAGASSSRTGASSNRKEKSATSGRGSRKVVVKKEEEDIPGTDVWSPPAVVAPPKVSTDDLSLCYFVSRFVSPDGMDGFPGHLTFLPGMFDRYGEGVLEQATLSVAKMAAYNQFGGEEFRLQSYQTYGRAIKSLQEAIRQESNVTDDRVLASILLLCTLKDISGESTGDPNEHAAGLYYLLEKRGVEQLATRRGAELFLLALIRLQIYSFLREDDSYSDPGGLVSAMGVFDPLVRAMAMMTKTLSLRHQLSNYVTFPDIQSTMQSPSASSPTSTTTITVNPDPDGHAAAVGACLETLEDFDNWDHEAASYWQRTFEDRAMPTALGEVGTKMTYCDPPTACTIILVRSARLILLLSLLTYHKMMSLGDAGSCGDMAAWEHWLPTLHGDVHKTIDDILACVPFVLGDVDPKSGQPKVSYDGAGAIVITQPLRLVTYCAYARPDQTEMARKILERINAIGIKSAVSWDGEPMFPSDFAATSPATSFSAPAQSPPTLVFRQAQNEGSSLGAGVV